MSDMGELFAERRKAAQNKRAMNRENAQPLLKSAGIEFHNYGAGTHLGVFKGVDIVDYWPGTGLWAGRKEKIKGRGIESLIRYVKGED